MKDAAKDDVAASAASNVLHAPKLVAQHATTDNEKWAPPKRPQRTRPETVTEDPRATCLQICRYLYGHDGRAESTHHACSKLRSESPSEQCERQHSVV